MSNYFSQYCVLLGSIEQFTYCRQAYLLEDLLARVKSLWNCTQLSDNELLDEISRLNQMPVDDTVKLAGNWLPYRYQPKHKRVHWLLPVGHATEPFQDEYISRCCQQLFNQIFQPRTSLNGAIQQAKTLADVQPAGFIFHLSRCGSTLISGCLSELATTCVFSEAPLLTELLLDAQLTLDEQQNSLRAFINLQAAAFSQRPQMIIKWNAWDIFRWQLIRELYPQVPVVFLVREPVEILASHQRMAGRHMSGDPSLVDINPVFISGRKTLLSFRSDVLAALLGEMSKFSSDSLVLRVDYRHLDAAQIRTISNHFGVFPDDQSFQQITRRLQFHSKMPGAAFSNDARAKQALFAVEDKATIEQSLMPIYYQFLGCPKELA
ncbi:MAG TPA: sulfotransferase family protein [Cellvibrio sp.]|nr:sulfotransferase family protein [Cellvibrio sp.]